MTEEDKAFATSMITLIILFTLGYSSLSSTKSKNNIVLSQQNDIATKQTELANMSEKDKLRYWNTNFIKKYKVRQYVKKQKRKIKVAIIDTGFAPKLKFKNIKYDSKTSNSHGTEMGSIILGVNDKIELISFNIFNSKRLVDETERSILKAIEMNVDIINISLSGELSSERELSAIKKAELKGIIIISAAGNNSKSLDDCDIFPACYTKFVNNIIVVGNMDNQGNIGKSSNYGKYVDVFSFGTDIETLGQKEDFQKGTGTSYATAMVSGFLSLAMSQSKKKMTVSEIKEFIHNQKNGQYNFYKNPELISDVGLNQNQKDLASR